MFVTTGGERGVPPPRHATKFETLGLEEASKRVALIADGIGGASRNWLYWWVRDRWERKARRRKKGTTRSGIVSLAPLAGGRGAVAIRTSAPITYDEAFVFRFPLWPEREPKTSAERERQHARDLKQLVAFLVKRGASRLLPSGPRACPRCGRTIAPTEAKCPGCRQWRMVPPRISKQTITTLDQVQAVAVERIVTGGPWDACWGGGFAATSVTLLGGKPGGGKTTLLLQIAARLAEVRGRKTFIVNVEMSAGELRIVADRLRLPLDGIVAFPTFEAPEVEVEDFGVPAALVLDSITDLCEGHARSHFHREAVEGLLK